MLKVVLQDGIKDCGICCLLSIIRYYGGEISKEMLRKLTNTNKDGVTAYNLIEAANTLGLEAYGVSGDMSNIKINNLPCIAHIHVNANYQHFVVIYKIDKKNVVIMDPSKGKRVLSHSEFKLMSTNHYIFIHAKKKLPTIRTKKVIRKELINHFHSNRKFILLLTFFTFQILILSIMIAFHFKYILQLAIHYDTTQNIYLISITILAASILLNLITLLHNKLLYKILFMFDAKITFKTFKQLLLLPYFYYKNRTTGEVLSRINDLTTMKKFLVSCFSSFISDIISILLFFIIIFQINTLLSLCILGYLLIILIYVFYRSKKKKKTFQHLRHLEDNMNSYIVEAISNVDTTKGSHLEKRFSDNFLLKYKRLLDKNYKYISYLEFDNLFIELFHQILTIIIYGLGGYFVIINKLSLVNLIIYQTFFQYILKSFHKMLIVLEETPNYFVCLGRVEDLFTIMEERFDKSYYFLNYKLDGDIQISNLYYSINNKIILNNLSITIYYKDKVLLYGSSGSGKSTFVKSLMRYIEIPFGKINIKGIDINHYHLENIRKYITYVSANELLFNDSIYNNICLSNEISEEEFIKIIKITKVNLIFGEDIKNYHNQIEENGFLLSGGERQRIILARALTKQSNIYIFDEAFGQIDIDLTNKIIKDIFKYLDNKTVIVISHRQNTKKYFNRILNMIDGKIYEKKL